MTKELLIQNFIKKLDYSYSYKTKDERDLIIAELYNIANFKEL